MGAQQGNGERRGSGPRNACDLGISRSRIGWLSVRFDGGPSYPEMVAILKEMVDQYGGLVKRGERISGYEWLRRIDQRSVQATDAQRHAIQTLMRSI